MGEVVMTTWLSFSDLARLSRLNRSSRCLDEAAWRAIWRESSKACCGAELARILRLAITKGKAGISR
jgi:hypothetical protein